MEKAGKNDNKKERLLRYKRVMELLSDKKEVKLRVSNGEKLSDVAEEKKLKIISPLSYPSK